MAKEAKKKPNRKKLLAQIPGVYYKGSGKNPAVNELLKHLKKHGADSIPLPADITGPRWKVQKKKKSRTA